MGGVAGKAEPPEMVWVPETKLEAKMVEAMQRRASEGTAMKSFNSEEINDLFKACYINEDMRIKFNEFIVLLCLVYLLKDNATAREAKSRMGMPNLEATFETLVDAFVFLDKNKDGFISKNEMVQTINESGERSSGRIAMKRFEEMDWDKNGWVSFKEFLFAFTSCVGIDDVENDEEEEGRV
ncbi:hypothetical protein CRYUN_Cryun38cG0083300 [Craigia yunnanensis]